MSLNDYSEEEEDPSSSDEASDEDYDEDEEIVDWDWARSLKPSKLKEDELKRLIHIFQTWKPPDIGEEVGMEKKVLLMYELSVGAFLSRESDLKDALEELQEKGGRGSEDKLREENKQLKSQVKKLIKKSKSGKNSDEAIEEILQLEQELSRYKHECDHLEREVDRERGGKEALETKVESLQKERKSLKKEINNLKDELVDSRRSVEDDEAEQQEVELKRVRELEESIRLKNKQIHQLLEDIELVEKDNENYQNNVVNLRDRLSEATNQINSLTGEYVSSKESVERLNTLVKDLESENSHLQTLLDDFHSDKIRRDENLESLGRKVDERFESLKDKLKERDAEIEELRARLNRIQLDEDQNVYAEGSDNICAHGSGKMVRDNVAVLSQAIKEREEQIEALRRDLVQATRNIGELDRYAKLIENLNLKKNKDRHGIDPLQKVVVDLQAELYEVNMRVSQLEEETNDAKEVAREKTEELSECIARLHSYEKGEFGLEQSIEEIKRLKKKLKNDEEQIRRLTSSCNHLQYSKSQLEEENTGSSAESKKDTNKQIQQERALMQVMQREIERLEEERLLLKTENRKLARQLGSKSAEIGLTPEDLKNIQEYSDALRYRRRHMSPTDTGGSSMIESHKRMTNLENEVRDLKSTIQQKENDCSEVTMKYNDMLEENKELRTSMREILDSIQSQDADSNVKIESESLDRILSVLDARHLWGEYHPAMEMNTRIQRLEGCNQELRNQIKKSRKDEERFSIQISKYVSRIQELESHLISYKEDIKSRPLIEDQKESDHSVLEEYDVSSNQANTSIAPIQATDVSVKLNFQLIQISSMKKEAFNKKLESEIESLHGKINVQRHQMGLLYEEHREKKNKWELEMKKMEVEHTEQADEMKKLLIKVEEYEKDLDNDQVRSETLKKIVILRSNEAMMVRRYRAMEDSEKLLREEVKKLKDDSFKMEIEIVRKLGSLQRYKEIASFKIEALQKSISKSVPIAELDSLNCQYSDLLLKYKELVQTNQTIAAQSQELNSDNEMPQQSLVQECNKLKNEVSLSQEKINSLEKVIESFNKSIKVGGSEEEFSANQYSKQSQISELGNRNNDLEIKFKEISSLYTELQKNERYLQDQILNNVTKEEYDELNDKLKKLELSEAKLNNERDELKEISDIATNQISVLENKKKNENIELESLRHQVIDLQTQTDEKSIIGKLHRQVILLQLRESEAAIKIKGMENQVRKSDLQLFRQSKKCEEYENIIFKTRLESNKKLKKMYKMIQDLRHRYTGSIIPLSKQESLLQNYLKIIEDKRKIGIVLRKAEEERLESEILKEELRIKLNSETSSQSPQCKEESMNKFQELQLQEMKTRFKIERLETEVIRKESLFENKYFSEWDPVYNSLLIVESKDKESKGLDYNIKSPGHDEPLSTQLDSALQKNKKTILNPHIY
ncbi:unnamed protein product [Lepeophtheirus salmonis]|uniref:(salmon louse) hypothetical protein n=1 Tax=Lepeophtheirus salmonis TaxID=72036 RepID=A0A7R8H5Q3_LEPSM|nr:unnamed protein product [Lepeophtheirus salmonis]CAF2881987.1 unnamed protein product [Lepeophtheirus salmonis]